MNSCKKNEVYGFLCWNSGGRLGLELSDLKCVGYSEIDDAPNKTYRMLYNNEEEVNFGDLMKIEPKDLPDFDVMIAGFPCQHFL